MLLQTEQTQAPFELSANPFALSSSSAPIGSKDEQAELIRKQKAKLERHFRRSTTAVSYEDIKSAEATIKGALEPAPSGVSSPSTLFDKPAPPHSATINLHVSAPPAPTAQSTAYLRLDAPALTHASHNLQHTIANDIETDKLLNAIEKSKGFSDSKSTQARRVRNKALVLEEPLKSGGKVQSLRWNEEKLELEVVRREREAEVERQNQAQNKTSPTYVLRRQNSGPTLDVSVLLLLLAY